MTRSALRVSEKDEQRQIIDLLRKIGAAVYVLGHPSPNDGRLHRGTGQTSGLPDLYVFLPPCKTRHFPYRQHALWIEVKGSGGRLRPEQREFRDHCRESVTAYLVGGVNEVANFLVGGGWLVGNHAKATNGSGAAAEA